MRRLVSLLAAGALAAALLVFAPNSPASANGVCVGVLGTATTGAGLTYPNPLTTPTLGRVSTTFGAVFGGCVNVHTTPPVVTANTLIATGTVDGWCGHSVGAGTTSTGETFVWVSAGSFLVLTGGLTGVAKADPDIGESCSPLGPGADEFLVTGVTLKLHCAGSLPVTVLSWTIANICIPAVLP